MVSLGPLAVMIDIRDSTEFRRLLQAMSRDVVDAHIHYRLFKDVHAALSAHSLVEIQSRTFWGLTLSAHLNASLQSLCRVYDQNPKALHLRSWLDTIQDNLTLFSEHEFRERLKDNAFVDSLARTLRRPDERQLAQDIENCSLSDPLVKNLMVHRGSRIAHKSAKNVVAEKDIGDRHPLTYGGVELLLDRAIVILNRYSNLFGDNTYSTQIIGHDDSEFIIHCVEEKVEESRANRRRKIDGT
jgi:hypothetical protein